VRISLFQVKNNMKKILAISLIGAAWAFSPFAFGAEEKESEKEPSKSGSKTAVTAEHKIFTPSEMNWADAPPGLPPGAKMAVLDGNPTKKGSFTVRLQAADGYKIPPHTHPTTERVTVISGTFHLGMGDKFDETTARELSPGGFAVLPAGMKHFGWMTGETIVQIQSEGPFIIKYVNPADDPRNTKK
jgi:quercetin dioxygenase-like cupin family protein